MRNWYREFFYVPKHGKENVREKVVLTRISTSIFWILICMVAMSVTAYAYFTSNISSTGNTIRSAKWMISVTAEADVTSDEGIYLLDNSQNDQPRTYQFTIEKDPQATASLGYATVLITVGDSEAASYYTQPIGEFLVDGEMTQDLDRKVLIAIPAGKTAKVKIVGEWGSCARTPILDESVPIDPTYPVVEEDNDDETTTTTTVTTTTEATTTVTTVTEATTTAVTTVTAATTTATTPSTVTTTTTVPTVVTEQTTTITAQETTVTTAPTTVTTQTVEATTTTAATTTTTAIITE